MKKKVKALVFSLFLLTIGSAVLYGNRGNSSSQSTVSGSAMDQTVKINPGNESTSFLQSKESADKVLQQFKDPDSEYRGGFRYVLPSAYIAEDEVLMDQLEAEIRDFYDQGFGYIEIAISGGDQYVYDYGKNGLDSENWKTVLKRIYSVSNEIGMTVQLHMGFSNSGEPVYFFDEPSDGSENFRQKMLNTTESIEVAGGTVYSTENPLMLTGTTVNTTYEPVAVLAIQYEQNEDGTKQQVAVKQLSLEDFEISLNKLPEDEWEDLYMQVGWSKKLIGTIANSVNFTYTGDALTLGKKGETWDVIAYYQIPNPANFTDTGKMSFKVSDTDYCIVNYFSVEGAEAAIESYMNNVFNDTQLIEMIKENGGGFMYDGADKHPTTDSTTWSEDLPETFEATAGYDLLDYLGVIYSGYALEGDEAERIAYDKLNALTELYCGYINTMGDWAESLNTTYIHQAAFSTDLNTMTVMMEVNQPETESLGFADNIAGYISVTGASHLAGHDIISNEMGATSRRGYQQTWYEVMTMINTAFVGGVNEILLHTANYLYSETCEWPSHDIHYYLSGVNYNASQPFWLTAEFYADYIARSQYILRQGEAQRDVAIYLHEYSASETEFDRHETLMSYGFTYDFFNPAMLTMDAAQVVEDGVIDPDGGAYKAFVVNNSELLDDNRMSTQSANSILAYAEAGVPIFLVGTEPGDVEGLSDSVEKLATIWDSIKATGMLTIVKDETALAEALLSVGIRPNAENEAPCGVISYMRATDEANYYFLYNQGDVYAQTYEGAADVNQSVSLKGEGQPYLMDVWTGEITPIADYISQDGYVTVNLNLEINEATIIKVSNTMNNAVHATAILDDDTVVYDDGSLMLRSANGEYSIPLSDGSKKTLVVNDVAEAITLNDWTLAVESWTPTYEYGTKGVNATLTTKTMLGPIKLDKLKSWGDIEELGKGVSGIGYYTTTFTVDGECDGAMLSIGSVFDSVRIYINGEEVFANQMTLTADLGGYVQAGENTLEIVMPTGLFNTILQYGVDDFMVAAPYVDYGMFGDVVVTPYVLSTLY